MYKTLASILLAIQFTIILGLSAVCINANIKAEKMDDTIGFFNMICIGVILLYIFLGFNSWNHIQKSTPHKPKEPNHIAYNTIITFLPLFAIAVIIFYLS